MTTGNIKFTQQPPIPAGSITSSTIVPAVESFTNYKMTMGNLVTFVNTNSGNISATGNITGTYILGNGSQLTGLPATYSNANATSLLASFGSNTISTAGNITGGYFNGNGSQLTGIVSSYGNANVVTLLAGFGSNVISTTGNITGGYILGNGSQLTGLPQQYGNSNVVTLLAGFGSNTISTSGNITGSYILGNGSQLTGLPANYGNSNVVNLMSNFGSNTISTNGNVSLGNLTVLGAGTALGNVSAGNINLTGNITGSYIFGNGSQLTGIASTYGNSNVVTLLAGFGSNSISTTGTVSSGNVSATGNVTANFLNGIIGTPSQTAITSVGTLLNLNVSGSTNSKYYIETVYSGGNTGTTVTPVQTNGSVQKYTANNNFTLATPTGMTTGSSITLIFTQDATGNRVMTPNSNYKFAYGSKTLSTTANAIDVISVFYDGTNYLCNLVKGYTA